MSAGLGAKIGRGTGQGMPKVVTAALVAGTISKITGGKFANGAASAAFFAAVSTDWGGDKGFGLFTSNSDLEKGYQESVSTYGSQDSSFKLSEELALDYTTSGPEGFSEVVAGHIEGLSATADGRTILTGLAESGTSINIFKNIGQSAATQRGSFDFSWSGTTIAFDPNYVRAPAGLFVTNLGRPISPLVSPTNALGYELVHAWQNTSYFNGAPRIPGNVTGGNPWERQAVRYINRIRQQQGLNYTRVRYN